MAFGKSQKDPFGTPVGHLIEKATFGALQTEEWGQFMHICDIINTTEEGPKDAIRALKKRLSKNCNHVEIRLTLSLLDMCMQNCGPSFQSLVVKRDFCKDRLIKLLNPRFNLPVDMQEKILTFIMTWARGFQGAVDVSEVKEVYLELLKKGVEFPACGIQKPLTQTSTKALLLHSTSKNGLTGSLPAGTTITLIPEQIGKLYSELDMAKMNARVMSAILKENVPGSENPDDMELLQKLYKTCRVMQERIMELLATVQNEDVITELIQVNENLNNVLLGHERFSRNRVRFLENQRIQNERTAVNGNQPSAPSSDLLDLESSFPATVPKPGGADPVTSPFSELNCRPSSVAVPSPHLMQPSLYPQLNPLPPANTLQTTFVTEAQSTSQSFPVANQYENVNSILNPVPLQPVSLQINGTRDIPAADGSKRHTPPPNYYELMEFDPLAPSDKTEPIYEEIDAHLFRPSVKGHTSC
ncbi:PREDICTED: TOM1-like protein 1 [Gekko japonicus]|uniref:TOM1-like protein 1 n=1 Tax=Gekko japonicus TaxID=146911 RepID=A0ABM1LGE1_GEKJA|nr:PREDICTED: TOM1-like protein 1 [Gekko japonicus]